MTIRLRTALFLGISFLVIWFLYIEKAILTPFILGAIFAYIFNPIVNFFYHKIRLPRVLSILLIYLILISTVITLGFIIVTRLFEESSAFINYLENLKEIAFNQVKTLPEFVKPTATEALASFEKIRLSFLTSLFPFFSQAISSIVSFFIFLFSAFYFLKEGKNISDKLIGLVPNDYQKDIKTIVANINLVLNGYLRGQLLIVFISFLLFFMFYSIIGVRFALILAIFSGFMEAIPFVGPLTSGTVGALTVLIGGAPNFSINPIQATLVVIVANFLIRQAQDYLISPHIMGRAVKLHPLIILFAVILGGHLGGVLGLILAIPVASIIRILFKFSIDKMNQSSRQT